MATAEDQRKATDSKNINELETICKEEWSQIPCDICLKLVKNYMGLADIIMQKDYTIDY